MQKYTSTFQCKVYKVRIFDTSIRIQFSVIELISAVIELQFPIIELYDNIIYYVRSLDTIEDPFNSTKDDTPSFFSINSQKEDLIESTYISTNLKIITPFSESLHKPLSRFDSVKSVSGVAVSASGTDTYVGLNFEEIEDYANLEIVRNGMSCVLCGCNDIVPTIEYDMFEYTANISDLKFVGLLSGTTLAQNYYTSSYCSFYYGILYIPSSTITYYFSFVASSVGYLFIDNKQLLSQETQNSVSAVTGSILLSEGYHTFTIMHYASATSTNDIVRLQFKTEPQNSYIDFNVVNLNNNNVLLLSYPLYIHSVLDNADTFMTYISNILDSSLDSLHIKKYRPLIVLARKYSNLIQKEINRIYYHKIPDIVDSSVLVSGILADLDSSYDFPVSGKGVILNTDRNTVLSPYITYTYLEPVLISQFEILDSNVYGSTVSDYTQCWSFTFSIVTNLKERLSYAQIVELIDIDASVNIEMFQSINNSETYVRVIKLHVTHNTIIVFKNALSIRELTIRDPTVPGLVWGTIMSFKVYLKATEIVKLIDGKGMLSILENIDDSTLLELPYNSIGQVPTIFEHNNISPDIQYGAEFIMFCLNVLGNIDPIELLGNMYTVYNSSEHTIFNTDCLLNIRQLDQLDDRKFIVTTNLSATTLYDFAYVGYSTSLNTVIQTDFHTITVDLTNISTNTLINLSYLIKLPNVGLGYTCIDQNTNVVPVVGVTSTEVLVNDSNIWDTQLVRVQIPILTSQETITLIFSNGIFSDTSLITGSIAVTYDYLPDLQQLPLIVVRVPIIAAEELKDIAVLTSLTIATPSQSILFDVPTQLTVATLYVNSVTGSDRIDVEINVDISDLLYSYTSCMFTVYDAITKMPLDTVGVNNDNSVTVQFSKWNGYRIRFRIPLLKGGVTSCFLIRVGVFQGDISTFLPSVQNNLRHNFHFSGNLVDSIIGVVGTGYNVTYNVDMKLEYYKAAQFLNTGYAVPSYIKLAATTASTNFSISFWFVTSKENCGILCFSNTSTLPSTVHDLLFSINANGHLVFTTTSGISSTIIVSDKSYIDAQWHHVVLTCHSTLGMTLYVDKLQKGINTIVSKSIVTSYVYLGWSLTYFDGSIDEFRVYDVCLTSTEVAVLNLVFDGTYTDTEQRYQKTSIVHSPVGALTTLVDTSSLLGDIVYIYKYINIDETIVRYL